MAIYKPRNTGTGKGMRGMQGTRRIFTRIPGNPLEDCGECSHFSILGNAQENSGELLERFLGMFGKIPGNAFNFKLIKVAFYLKKANVS